MLFFERKEGGEYAVLVDVVGLEDVPMPDFEEFKMLVSAAGVTAVESVCVTRKRPNAAFFIGKGKVHELKELIHDSNIDVVLVNQSLTPGQERNLEKELQCRVVDRTGVILDIFAQRARTHEGKLQVELAQLGHLSTRLIRGWTHLERQKGGVGLRGPGETQLESDRRMLRDRIKKLKSRLTKVKAQRSQNRTSRMKSDVPIVSLVGYTNAGKSTLFNLLTGAEVLAKNMLFATLDPTYRSWTPKGTNDLMLIDTVGFIKNLPHKLVEAFSATLEESIYSHLLLHVVDGSHEQKSSMIEAVNLVLESIHADTIPSLQVFNKIDLIDMEPKIDRNEIGQPFRVWISVKENKGLDLLEQAVLELIGDTQLEGKLLLNMKYASLRAQLYELDAILDEEVNDQGGLSLHIKLAEKIFLSLIKQYDLKNISKFESINDKYNW
jgi:GTPase